jgi:hypothetical protein
MFLDYNNKVLFNFVYFNLWINTKIFTIFSENKFIDDQVF